MYQWPKLFYITFHIWDSLTIPNAVIIVPCIFLQPFSSAYSFVYWYCLWHQISLPKTKSRLMRKWIRQKPQIYQKNLT